MRPLSPRRRATRFSRMLNFIKAFPPGPEDSVDYVPGVSHNTTGMFVSDAGIHRLLYARLLPACALSTLTALSAGALM